MQRARAFYSRHPLLFPALFFLGGVVWDALTLRRIDALVDNLLLLGYLLALGGLITVAALVEHGRKPRPRLARLAGWLPLGIQFLMGALFSAYVVYYSQSASLSETAVFLGVLVVLLVANEFIHHRVAHLYLLVGLYFLCVFSFCIFFVPVALRAMTYWTFLGGGVLSVALVGLLVRFWHRQGVFQKTRQYVAAMGIVGGLFAGLNVFYVQNWIPPVPLALREGGVFHHVERAGGAYRLSYAAPPFWKPWVRSDAVFHYRAGEPAYCFAAVFAPTQLRKGILHEWQHYDAAAGLWRTTDRIPYRVVGGRDGGYRGYTLKRRLRPGRWRVQVKTDDGRLLGRLVFHAVPAAEGAAPPALRVRLVE